MSAFAGGLGPFGSMSVADLGSLTRLEVSFEYLKLETYLKSPFNHFVLRRSLEERSPKSLVFAPPFSKQNSPTIVFFNLSKHFTAANNLIHLGQDPLAPGKLIN